ncbi:unnamed protein product [Moneuplotes crassus]|uniref:Uncharacterized protein n=1 Tax=Euplotes crassus TaxID=5936 RepID=A0AAD1XR42_EUPCR|nr:unnamed protein product [Moneuplotes crassus]
MDSKAFSKAAKEQELVSQTVAFCQTIKISDKEIDCLLNVGKKIFYLDSRRDILPISDLILHKCYINLFLHQSHLQSCLSRLNFPFLPNLKIQTISFTKFCTISSCLPSLAKILPRVTSSFKLCRMKVTYKQVVKVVSALCKCYNFELNNCLIDCPKVDSKSSYKDNLNIKKLFGVELKAFKLCLCSDIEGSYFSQKSPLIEAIFGLIKGSSLENSLEKIWIDGDLTSEEWSDLRDKHGLNHIEIHGKGVIFNTFTKLPAES